MIKTRQPSTLSVIFSEMVEPSQPFVCQCGRSTMVRVTPADTAACCRQCHRTSRRARVELVAN